MLDRAARDLGLDAAGIRRRNLVRRDEFPDLEATVQLEVLDTTDDSIAAVDVATGAGAGDVAW